MGNSESSSSGRQAASSGGAPSSGASVASAPVNASSSNASVAGAAPPGAYRMPGQPRSQRFYVTIPRGVRPGQHFAVLVNGQQMMVIKAAIIFYN